MRKYCSGSALDNLYPDPDPPYKRFPTQEDPDSQTEIHVWYGTVL